MQIVSHIKQIRQVTEDWRHHGQTIAFVPTMGNLHAGHIKLVNAARKNADRVVVSIFVNPAQFGEGEDYDSYPRTEQEDANKLEQAGVDLLFLPGVSEMYPHTAQVSLLVAGIAQEYCGKSRPGHFNGVVTVVCKLFNIVQPDTAFFGEKDYQQLTIIRQMVTDLNFPLQIWAVPTAREQDGLAMSSRNRYLTSEQRAIAPALYASLCRIQEAIQRGDNDFATLVEAEKQCLISAGIAPEYLKVARRFDLQSACPDDRELVVLVAARLGRTRLIDNVVFIH